MLSVNDIEVLLYNVKNYYTSIHCILYTLIGDSVYYCDNCKFCIDEHCIKENSYYTAR